MHGLFVRFGCQRASPLERSRSILTIVLDLKEAQFGFFSDPSGLAPGLKLALAEDGPGSMFSVRDNSAVDPGVECAYFYP